ncbi:MAG: nuclear transport factor 2 family protein [Pseudomonadota bacterium]
MNHAAYLAVLVLGCSLALHAGAAESGRSRLDAASNIVAAVNAKDAVLYTRDLAEDVVVAMYDGDIRLRGRAAVRANREEHFRRHPAVRNELVHLVEIDDRVVMHDRVWLTPEQEQAADIVEVFTFSGAEIVRIDVLQPGSLFASTANENQ